MNFLVVYYYFVDFSFIYVHMHVVLLPCGARSTCILILLQYCRDVTYYVNRFFMLNDSQLEEELFKASYVLSEGDAAAFLPSKSHGLFFTLCYCNYYYYFIMLVCEPACAHLDYSTVTMPT